MHQPREKTELSPSTYIGCKSFHANMVNIRSQSLWFDKAQTYDSNQMPTYWASKFLRFGTRRGNKHHLNHNCVCFKNFQTRSLLEKIVTFKLHGVNRKILIEIHTWNLTFSYENLESRNSYIVLRISQFFPWRHVSQSRQSLASLANGKMHWQIRISFRVQTRTLRTLVELISMSVRILEVGRLNHTCPAIKNKYGPFLALICWPSRNNFP